MGKLDRNYGKGGKGTKRWGLAITQAVEDGRKLKTILEQKGCKFESARDGTLGFKVTLPNGTILPCVSVWEVRDMLECRQSSTLITE